jgi:hypothetical protein
MIIGNTNSDIAVRQLQPTFNHFGHFTRKFICPAGCFDKASPRHSGVMTESCSTHTDPTQGSILLCT